MPRIDFQVGREKLVGELVGSTPQLLVLHGAGQANRERAKPLIESITKETGRGAFLFDFSGHGESSGTLNSSSLQKRTAEADEAWKFLTAGVPITVIGFSMGGHVALELLASRTIDNLILFYPGLYTNEAFNVPFDERFSEVIRKPDSWRSALALNYLRDFKGNLLVVWGENDAVVPRGVVDLLYESASSARSREVFVVANGEHLLLPQLYSDSKLQDQIVAKVKNILV